MSLPWPWALIALLAFPSLLGFRWWMRRRRRREAVRMSSVALIRAALPGGSSWRRRIPLWLFAAGLVVLGVGAARPQASVLVPSDASSILLAMDVSGSMCSTDVAPNRLTAAQNAARDFVKAQDNGTKIGLVVFSGIAALRVEPTTNKDELLAAIAEINPDVAPTGVDLPPIAPGADGEYEPDTIVVLTDGANTQGVDPVTAAKQAAVRHLRIYTIGFGTTRPAPLVCTADQISGDAFGANRPGQTRGFGGRRNQDLDEDALTQVATITGGKYFQAKDSKTLTGVLMDLPSSIVLQREDAEITVWFALAGAVFVLVAIGLTQWWNRSGPFPASAAGAASATEAAGAASATARSPSSKPPDPH